MKTKHHIFLVITLVFTIFLSGCLNQTGPSDQVKETTYERVLRTNEIRVGYISYPPSLIKDPNSGKLSGIFYDVIESAAKNMDIDLKYTEEVGWGTMVEALNSGRVDIVVAGIWPTSTRGKKADFTTPIYYSVVRAYTRSGNNTYDNNLDKINDPDTTISTIDGEMTSIIASSDFPSAKAMALPQNADVSQVLLEVASGKADITFVEPAIAEEYMSKNPGKIKAVEGIPPLRVFPNVMMVNKGEINFLSMMNIAITELINTGYVDKVIDKYEKYPGSFKRVSLPYRR